MRLSAFALLALLTVVACDSNPRSPPQGGPALTQRGSVDVPPVCQTPPGGLRITADRIAGLPMRATFRTLRQICRSALDSVAPGGYQALAMRFDFPGGQVWAVSGADAYGGRIPEDSTPEFWWASGDSLRFQSGALVPRSVGGLLAADSDAVLRADGADDTEGSYIIPCREPRMALVLGYVASLPDSGAWPLTSRRVPDSLLIERVTINTPPYLLDPALPRLCRVPPAT
jgi:hypothetical protein